MSRIVAINEVGPRDGFQNIKTFIPTATKLKIIEGIIASGVKKVQVTSFMNPKAVPQVIDAKEVATACLQKYSDRKDLTLYGLAANARGVQSAAEVGLGHLSYVISASETHNQENVRKSVQYSMDELKELVKEYSQIHFILDTAMAFECSFEGPISDAQILSHIEKGAETGITSFNICDSNGMATPDLVKSRLSMLMTRYPEFDFRVHIHDTRNMGMLNTLAAIECGVKDIEVSLCGLGGCPFFPGASGNTSTEDLVYMLNKMGYDTGVNFESLLEIAKFTKLNVQGNFSGHHINITSERCYQ